MQVENENGSSLIKSMVGFVGVAALGVTFMPGLGTETTANDEGNAANIEAVHVSHPPKNLVWDANSVQEIAAEIEAQLLTQEEVDDQEYVIQWGDTVWGITEAFDLDMNTFVENNAIENPDLIFTNDLVTLDISDKLEEN